jgi:hypothetical protein
MQVEQKSYFHVVPLKNTGGMGKVPKNSTFVAYELIHFFLPG